MLPKISKLIKALFTKGMDSDTTPEFMQIGTSRNRLNVRILSSNDGGIGSAESVNGNILINYTLPSGNNTVIGSYEYIVGKKNYYFVYNDTNNHSILQYDQILISITCVFQSSILNFQITNLITGINVQAINIEASSLENHLLYFTDNWVNPTNPNQYNEPKKINIEKGIAFMAGDYVNGYKFPFDPEILFRIKQYPLYPPTYTWSGLNQQEASFKAGNDANPINLNPLYTFFTVVFNQNYFDPQNRYTIDNSTWNVPSDGNYYVNAQVKIIDQPNAQAYIYIVVNGYPKAKTIITVTSNDGYALGGVAELLPLSAGNKVTIWASGELNSIQDYFPQASGVYFNAYPESATKVTVNNLFKKLFVFQIQFVYDDYEQSAFSPYSPYIFPSTVNNIGNGVGATGSVGTFGDDIVLQDNIIIINVPTGNSIVTKINIYAKEISNFVAPTLSSLNFSLIATLNKAELGIPDNSVWLYEFTNEVNAVIANIDTASKLYDNVPLYSKSQEIIFGERLIDGSVTENQNPTPIDMRILTSYTQAAINNSNPHFAAQSYLKSGGTYQLGIVYSDHAGRLSLTNVVNGLSTTLLPNGTYGTTLYIPFLTESAYGGINHGIGGNYQGSGMSYVPQINIEIYNKPPTWATHYFIIRSPEQTIGRYIQFVAQLLHYVDDGGNTVSNTDTNATSIIINIGNIVGQYKTENPNSLLVYDFVEGDRIRFIANPNGLDYVESPYPPAEDATSRYNLNINPFIDFNDIEITGWDAATQNISIKINNNPNLFGLGSDTGGNRFSGVLFEIYNRVAPIINNGELVYEIGECLPLTTLNGNLIHNGGTTNQLFYNYSSAANLGGFVAFTGTGISGLIIGDHIKIIGALGYNAYASVTSLSSSGGNQNILTDIVWASFYPYGGNIGEIVKGAVTTLTSGDCFRVVNNMCWLPNPTGAPATVYRLLSYVESMNACNMFISNAYDYGRPNAINNSNTPIMRITRESTVFWSELFIQETYINGFSSVFPTNFQTYDQRYGKINKVHSKDQLVEIYQQLKIGRLLVSQDIVTTTQGQSIIGQSENVLAQTMAYYDSDLGIGEYPESFANYNNRRYGIDVYRRIVWRLSNDGLIAISNEGNMSIFWGNLCDAILSSPTKVNIYGVYDKYFGTYIISVAAFTTNTGVSYPAQTLEWNEELNSWATFWSYTPENMIGAGLQIITFKNGGLWLHNQSDIQNNFYGIQYPSQLQFFINDEPSKVKVFEAISLEGLDAWSAIITTPITLQNPEGQTTALQTNNFRIKEGFHYAFILKNDLTPNVINPRFTGEPMRAKYASVQLTYSGTKPTQIFACNVLVIPSERSGK